MTIFVATSNPGKLRDFRAAAEEYPGTTIEPLPGLAEIAPPPEDEPTFEGNARSKAIYYSRFAPGAWVIADDSGLEVDALNGRPGVRSARFAADQAWPSTGDPDTDNNQALLSELRGIENRRGRYRCALALAMDGAIETVVFGMLEGQIIDNPKGSGGFGYDPFFFAPELNCTMAEAAMEARMRVSHRGRALRALLRRWSPC